MDPPAELLEAMAIFIGRATEEDILPRHCKDAAAVAWAVLVEKCTEDLNVADPHLLAIKNSFPHVQNNLPAIAA